MEKYCSYCQRREGWILMRWVFTTGMHCLRVWQRQHQIRVVKGEWDQHLKWKYLQGYETRTGEGMRWVVLVQTSAQTKDRMVSLSLLYPFQDSRWMSVGLILYRSVSHATDVCDIHYKSIWEILQICTHTTRKITNWNRACCSNSYMIPHDPLLKIFNVA